MAFNEPMHTSKLDIIFSLALIFFCTKAGNIIDTVIYI